MTARSLLLIAGILILVWVIAAATKWLVGTLLNVLLVVGVILLIIGAIKRLR